MDHRDAQLHQEIEHTRAAMTTKIDMIKARLDAQVEEGKSTLVDGVAALLEPVKRVWEMIDSVISTLEATVEKAQETAQKPVTTSQREIDLLANIRQSPWVMIGTAILVGYALGSGGRLFSCERAMITRPVPDGKPEGIPSSEPTDHSWSTSTGSATRHTSSPTPTRTGQPANPSIFGP